MIGQFEDKFVFFFVIFVMDLSHNLFKDIFQCDQPCHFAVLIEHNSNVKSRFPHFHEQFRDVFVLVSKVWLTHDVTDVEGFVLVVEKKIFHIDDTNNIVLSVFKNGKTGKLIFTENLDQLIVSIVYIGKCNVNTGNHDIFCVGVSQVKHVIDHLFFIGFDKAVLMAYIHDGTQLVLGHAVSRGVRVYSE